MKYEITLSAEEDFIEIWNYTANNWGKAQARSYLEIIEKSFNDIASENYVYRSLYHKDLMINYLHCGKHCIFFLDKKPPIITAILHEKMDFISALNKRLPV
ncbi:MAG: type II toxin-antitoxin system RelE/ParE family toxin [Rickettsiales bacterium]